MPKFMCWSETFEASTKTPSKGVEREFEAKYPEDAALAYHRSTIRDVPLDDGLTIGQGKDDPRNPMASFNRVRVQGYGTWITRWLRLNGEWKPGGWRYHIRGEKLAATLGFKGDPSELLKNWPGQDPAIPTSVPWDDPRTLRLFSPGNDPE